MNVGTSKRPLSHALTATERKGLEQQLAPLVQHMPKAKRGNTLCSDARSKLNDEDRPVQHGICLGLITGPRRVSGAPAVMCCAPAGATAAPAPN